MTGFGGSRRGPPITEGRPWTIAKTNGAIATATTITAVTTGISRRAIDARTSAASGIAPVTRYARGLAMRRRRGGARVTSAAGADRVARAGARAPRACTTTGTIATPAVSA